MNWRKRVDIKRHLEDEDLTYPEQAQAVLDTLRRVPEFADEDDGMLLEEMDDAVHELRETSAHPDAMEWFNAVLAGVYDVADRERIWLGP